MKGKRNYLSRGAPHLSRCDWVFRASRRNDARVPAATHLVLTQVVTRWSTRDNRASQPAGPRERKSPDDVPLSRDRVCERNDGRASHSRAIATPRAAQSVAATPCAVAILVARERDAPFHPYRGSPLTEALSSLSFPLPPPPSLSLCLFILSDGARLGRARFPQVPTL